MGAAEITWSELTIDRIEFGNSTPAHLEFEFAGEFEAMITAPIARDGPTGDDLEYVQGDAVAGGRFTFSLAREPNDPVGQFYFDQSWLEDWRVDAWVEGGAHPRWHDLFDADWPPGAD